VPRLTGIVASVEERGFRAQQERGRAGATARQQQRGQRIGARGLA
jgi:hypothetical protein